MQDIVPFGKENGKPARLEGSSTRPAETLTIARATKSQFGAFGMDFAHEGGSGFPRRFAWAA